MIHFSDTGGIFGWCAVIRLIATFVPSTLMIGLRGTENNLINVIGFFGFMALSKFILYPATFDRIVIILIFKSC